MAAIWAIALANLGTKRKQAWWNKHECNTVWKNTNDAIRHGIDLKVAITLAHRANTQPEARVAWFNVGETRACQPRKTFVSGD